MRKQWVTCGLCAGMIVFGLGIRSFGADAPAATAPAAKPFILRVLDAGTKQPLANVQIKYAGENNKMQRSATDADGKFVFDLPATSRMAYIQINDPAHVPMTLRWSPLQEPGHDHYDALLPMAVPISGSVQDEAGEPVSGATVVMISRTNDSAAAWPHARSGLNWEQVKTNADGLFQYNQAPEDLTNLQMAIWHPQYLANNSNDGFYSIDKVDNPATLRDGTFVKTLKKGIQITGRVVDSDGKPVTKASVGVGQDRVASNVLPTVKVDADGKFIVGGVAGQPITLTATAKGYAPDLQTFTVKDPPDELTLKLGPPQTLTGVVTDTHGKPLRGVNVYIDTWRGGRTINKSLTTDGSGRFTWKEAPADAVQADVMDQTHAAKRNIVMTAGTEAKVVLASPLTITGTVVDDATGTPINAFDVISGIKFDNDRAVRWERSMSERGENHVTGGKFVREFRETYAGMAVRIEAPGYMPGESAVFAPGDGEKTIEIRLKRGVDVSAVLTDAAGKPVSGADIMLALPGNGIQLQNGRLPPYRQDNPHTTSDANGKFSFPPQTGSYHVLAIADAGYLELTNIDLAKPDQTFPLKPWSKLEGTARIGSKPASGAEISAMGSRDFVRDEADQPSVFYQYQAKADDNGHFHFDRVVPGKFSVSRRVVIDSSTSSSADMEQVTVAAGETTQVEIGGQGRPLTGKIELPPELQQQPHAFGYAMLYTKMSDALPFPANYKQMSIKDRIQWMEAFRKSDDYKKLLERERSSAMQRRSYNILVQNDGTFRIDDVRPGTYQLTVQIEKPTARRYPGMGQNLGSASADVVVPPVPGGQTDEPLVVPTITAAARQHTEVGQSANDLPFMRLADEKSASLKDLRGKIVLLHFGGLTEQDGAMAINKLKTVQTTYAAEPKLAILSIVGGMMPENAKELADKSGVSWTIGLFDYNDYSPIAPYDMNQYPAFWLIDAEGKVVAKNVPLDNLENAVKAALSK